MLCSWDNSEPSNACGSASRFSNISALSDARTPLTSAQQFLSIFQKMGRNNESGYRNHPSTTPSVQPSEYDAEVPNLGDQLVSENRSCVSHSPVGNQSCWKARSLAQLLTCCTANSGAAAVADQATPYILFTRLPLPLKGLHIPEPPSRLSNTL
ncbi:hypothetical protein EDC04DRAFT_1012111 [Pisolithus marmoratus]|nr:hypothetical protein EDC04DRAFT_1012111 [Pisolithus marmoratus]